MQLDWGEATRTSCVYHEVAKRDVVEYDDQAPIRMIHGAFTWACELREPCLLFVPCGVLADIDRRDLDANCRQWALKMTLSADQILTSSPNSIYRLFEQI